MLGLKETIDQLAMKNSALWYCYVLRREDCHVLIRALDYEAEGQRKKGRMMRTPKKQVEEECVKVGLSGREDVLCLSKWIVVANQIATMLRWI